MNKYDEVLYDHIVDAAYAWKVKKAVNAQTALEEALAIAVEVRYPHSLPVEDGCGAMVGKVDE